MHTPTTPRARLIPLLLCLSLLAQSLIPTAVQAAPAGAPGKAAPPTGKAAVRQEAEAADLPDLNEVRSRPRHEPKAVPPVPSTRRRCPPRNPRCNEEGDGAPGATPTPAPNWPPRGNPNVASTGVEATPGTSAATPPVRYLASATASPLSPLWRGEVGGPPAFDLPLLDFYRGDGGYGYSDAPAAGPLAGLRRGYGGGSYPTAALVQGGATNLAQGKQATQSSTIVFNPPADAWHAVDGNTDGNYFNGSVTHTTGESQPWWRVDLGASFGIGNIDLWNRTDCCPERLSNYYVFVSDSPFTSNDPAQTQAQAGVWTYYNAGQPPTHSTFPVNRTGRYVRVQLAGTGVLSLAEVQVFAAGVQAVAPQGIPPAESVAWMNVVGASASGNSLTKVGADGWNTSGAMSTKAIAAGDGYVEWTASETSTYRMFGLSRGDTNQDYTDIDFAIYPTADGTLQVYEAGVYKAYLGGYAPGDRLRVSVEGGQVRYRRNGALLYTSTVTPQYPLLVDTSLYSTGATVTNAVISAPLPSQTDPGGTGLTGRYYDNADFTNYVMTRLDYTVNYDWGGGSPSASMGVDDFSVRWTGMVVPRYAETYTFYTTTDDGVRLWVDGQLIIDHWQPQAPTEWSGTIALEAGRQYTIRMEYYEQGGGAMAWLKWSSASQAKEIIPQSRLLPCWKGAEQFVTDFYQAVLRRAPSSYELQDWTERLTQAQGGSQQVAAAQALGRTVFGPTGMGAEYAALNPTDNHRFVSDLYWGYLQRAPDAGGWSWWEGQINSYGRPTGIAAFEDSTEFKEKVARLCGTAAASGTNGGDGYNFAAARLDPSNRTGDTNPYSRNYNFSIPLVSLAGRAGLDLGLTLSYNSLVWTKDGTGVTFDADRGTPGPGFRLGFPTLQPKFYNPQTQKYAYLLVTPAGERVELRQLGASSVYESADSSYLQLTEGDMTLRSTDGTQLAFASAGGEWRCAQVKDRNGNYIGVSYYGDGRIWTVTDTLGRVLTFNYDNYQNLLSITQPWRRDTEENPSPAQDETHSWATFGYANVTLLPQFSNLAVIGEQPGTVIPALSQVGLDDGSYYKFSYNQWGQVWKVTHYAADSVSANGQPNGSHPLTSTRLDLPGSDLQAASAQADCPRYTQERTWVENGVMNQSAEVTVTYDAWAPNMATCQVTLPDNATRQITNYYTSADGWKKGLTSSDVTTAGGTTVRTVAYTWEHDGASNAAFYTNPRVTQTSITDPLTLPQPITRTTRVTYTTAADFQANNGYTGSLNLRLPRKVEECGDANCSTVLRTSVTDYSVPNLDQYVARRILGLARYQYVYDGYVPDGAVAAPNLRSQVGYVYDEPNDADTFLAEPTAQASQHDGVAYGYPYNAAAPQQGLRWRGNANRVRRYTVDQQTGAVGPFVESRAAFNVTGTVAYTKDAAGHKSSVGYADSFFQNVNRTNPDPAYRLQTYAYPTNLTDPDNFTASSSYNYDLGVAREVQTPLPNVTANQPGPLSRRFYDAARRVVKAVNVDTGAYTRAVYPAKMDVVQTYTLIDAGIESYAAQVLDGAGRTRATAATLPGSAGGYAGQFFDLDAMGRLARQSNPTETSAAGSPWAATGADAANGWLYTQTSYDWKGRPQVVTVPKLNPNDPNEQLATREFEYGGCGCAGGEVVTIRGELVPTFEPPPAPAQGRRTQKVYFDELGRAKKTEVLKWDGSVYSTTTTKYNALDQAVRVRHYVGALTGAEPEGEGPGYQTTTMTYDGYGRLKTRRMPQYGTAPANVDTYEYNADNTIQSVTDPRGVKANYAYNNRHAVLSITYDTVSGVPDTPDVAYGYDAAGNRKWMTDGFGRADYTYYLLSRLKDETRTFSVPANGIAYGQPAFNNSFKVAYDYTAGGQLKSVTDSSGTTTNYHGSTVGYDYDSAGRLLNVTGSGFAGVSQYASGFTYRAWGAPKGFTYANGLTFDRQYDTRLRVSQYTIGGRTGNQQNGYAPPTVMKSDFNYYEDARIKYSHDLVDAKFDTAYTYDWAGRLVNGYSGSEAYDFFQGTNSGSPTGAYRQTYTHDAWDNLVGRTGNYWGYADNYSASYNNQNRRQGWIYDAAGNVTQDDERNYTIDAAGKVVDQHDSNDGQMTQIYDGDGRRIGSYQGYYNRPTYYATRVKYYLHSSVLGSVVSDILPDGLEVKGYVYANGELIAQQQPGGYAPVEWVHHNPVTGSYQITDQDQWSRPQANFDPAGVDVGYAPPQLSGSFQIDGDEKGFLAMSTAFASNHQCYLNGLELSNCALVQNMLRSGAAQFNTLTTVTAIYANGQTRSFTGYSSLPPGGELRLSGQMAHDAALAFNLGAIWGGFQTGVDYAIASALVPRGNSVEGRPGGVAGSFVFSFAPQTNVPAAAQRKILQNLRRCVRDLFKVNLKRFTPAMLTKDGYPKNGTFVGFGYDSLKNENTTITVTTDPGMYNHRDLTTMYNNFQKDHPEYRPLPRGYAGAGLTLPNSMVRLNDQVSESFIPYYNFIGNDLYTDPKTSNWALEILHVHELGHALAIITGKKLGAEDGDDLEFCVFGPPKPH